MITSFGIGQKTSEDGLPLLFFQAVPINPGYLFQQVSDVAIALDPEPDVRRLGSGRYLLDFQAADPSSGARTSAAAALVKK
jgi:hypothetical protein